MISVAILGAGPLGGALARELAARETARRVTLVDPAGAVAAGKALDIAQCGPVAAFDTMVHGAAALDDRRVDLLVVADHASSGAEWQGEADLAALSRLLRGRPGTPVLFAGARQGWLMAHAVLELGVASQRAIGSAPMAFEASVRSLVALEADVRPDEVGIAAAGTPPGHLVLLWEQATIGGDRLVDVLDSSSLQRVEQRARGLWPPGPFALSTAAAAVAGAIVSGARGYWSCLAVQPAAPGVVPVVASVPSRLGPAGILEVRPLHLSARQRVAVGP